MSSSARPLPSLPVAGPARGAARNRRASAAAPLALAVLLLATACAAPGMKFRERPGRNGDTATEMNGLRVTLRPLDVRALGEAAAAQDGAAALAPLLAQKPEPYKVGPQDVLLVTVWDHPEITLPLGQYRQDAATGSVVDEQGALYFPHVGKLQVAGLTISQVRDRVAAALDKVLQNPQVDVKVIAFRSQRVYIGGEVRNPGVYPVNDVPLTLAEAVNRAGGFLPASDDSRILLSRGSQTWSLNFQALMLRGNRIGQIYLKDGDSLQVPNVQDAPVYMLGELARPGTAPMIHGELSLAQAIQESGGIAGLTADARCIYVIRRGAAPDAVEVYHLDARNPTAMVLADSFPLRPRDMVYVDKGTVVRWGQVMNQILPTYTGLLETATSAKYLGSSLNSKP